MRELISVIIPVFNSEAFMERCLESVLNSTHRNLEVILIDDGSSDKSGEICDRYAKKDGRIIVIHQDNRGVSSARNRGIAIATGDYISFVDSDDTIAPNMFEVLLKNAVAYQADISCCGLVQISLDGEVKHQYCHGEKERFEDMTKLMYSFFTEPMYKEILYGPYNKIIKAKIVKDVLFNENYTMAEDLLFNFECLEKATVFYLDNQEFYHYLKRENSITTSKFGEKDFDYIYVADILLDKCRAKYPSIVEPALVWNYQKKLNICRRMCCQGEYRKKYKEQYYTWKNFCIENKNVVWRHLTPKNRVEYLILRSCPWLFSVVQKVFQR